MAEHKQDDESIPVLEGEYVESEAKPRRRWGRRLAWLFLVVLLAFAGGLAAAPYAVRQLEAWGLLPAAPPPAAERAGQSSDATAARIERRLAELSGRLGSLETAVRRVSEENAAAASRIQDLAGRFENRAGEEDVGSAQMRAQIESRLAAIAERLSALETASARAADAVTPAEVQTLAQAMQSANAARERLAGRIEALTRRMATLEALSRSAPRRAPALVQSLLALAERLETGRSYSGALARLREQVAALPEAARVGADAAFSALAPHAADGVATRTELAGRFEAVAAALQRAVPAPTDAGFFERLRRKLAAIVVVRPKTPGGGESLADRLARSEAALAAGDLARAVTAVEALPAARRSAADGWLADARARLEAARALRALMAIAGAPAQDAPDAADGEEGSS